MFLDVMRQLKGGEPPFLLETALDFADADFVDFTLASPASMRVHVTAENHALRVELHLAGTAKAECARCLEPVTLPFDFAQSFLIQAGDWLLQDPELPFTPDGRLDLRELAYQELLLERPIIFLCSESCEGLCHTCGQKRQSCTCETQKPQNPRWQALRDAWQQEE